MILPSRSLSQPIFLAILIASQCLFLLIIVIRLPFDHPVIANMPLGYITMLWDILIFVATAWAFHSTTPLIHYRENIGQFISRALQNYYGFGALLVYTSFHLLVFVLYLGRGRGWSFANNNDNNDIDWCYHNEWSSVMAMSALSTAILSAVKLVAAPTVASVVARFFMTHSLINALLLLRDGASRVALGAAFFPLLLAIAIYLVRQFLPMLLLINFPLNLHITLLDNHQYLFY